MAAKGDALRVAAVRAEAEAKMAALCPFKPHLHRPAKRSAHGRVRNQENQRPGDSKADKVCSQDVKLSI